ncbi:hypothetical protein GUJ93_ZPchr0009g469 [Zizania palustris]|uniref:Uncharacterized protein n=1 Tax=Zizania palustris TaxID=103762 RepID=A0A8J5S488_ZIZPA|nr:hypothetical protein GUJ93_ZPchr0009g469 [Zizania palustris]
MTETKWFYGTSQTNLLRVAAVLDECDRVRRSVVAEAYQPSVTPADWTGNGGYLRTWRTSLPPFPARGRYHGNTVIRREGCALSATVDMEVYFDDREAAVMGVCGGRRHWLGLGFGEDERRRRNSSRPSSEAPTNVGKTVHTGYR